MKLFNHFAPGASPPLNKKVRGQICGSLLGEPVMTMKDFRTYQYSVSFYRSIEKLVLKGHLRNQMLRAASSIVLNLAEGRGRGSRRDQKKFFTIALGSVRECQAILELAGRCHLEAAELADRLGGSIYLLIQRG